MKKPIIFLDIDGVLLDYTYLHAMRSGMNMNPAKIALLKTLLEETGADIVVSSAWSAEAVKKQLTKHRCYPERILGHTPRISISSRRDREILAWLEANPTNKWITLEDELFDMGEVLDHVIHIDSEIGLTPEDCEKAKAMLDQQ